jgi:hypothetical protein
MDKDRDTRKPPVHPRVKQLRTEGSQCGATCDMIELRCTLNRGQRRRLPNVYELKTGKKANPIISLNTSCSHWIYADDFECVFQESLCELVREYNVAFVNFENSVSVQWMIRNCEKYQYLLVPFHTGGPDKHFLVKNFISQYITERDRVMRLIVVSDMSPYHYFYQYFCKKNTPPLEIIGKVNQLFNVISLNSKKN